LPLLKTRWLCKKERKRVLLTMEPDADRTGVVFGVETDVPRVGGNAAQRREHDRRVGAGTMSRTGATCPCCGVIMTMEGIRLEGRAGRLGSVMTAVVVSGLKGKEYRLPTEHERAEAEVTEEKLQALYADIPFGLPEEPTPKAGSGASRAFSVDGYGFDTWRKLFTNRQLAFFAVLISTLRTIPNESSSGETWTYSILSYLLCVLGKQLDYCNGLCSWYTQNEQITHLFNRFALPIKWDFAETSPLGGASGSWDSMLKSVTKSIDTAVAMQGLQNCPNVVCNSATNIPEQFDVIVTDPPYYDAIPYSDCMDFFHVWLRRSTHSLSPEFESAFCEKLGPKWNHESGDGELIDDASRFEGDVLRSKRNYEDGMARVFGACNSALQSKGRFVIVFANKQPDAWETLVAALIRAGFVVDGSWPIQTEMSNRTRSLGSAALASSVWLVCRKRAPARPGWDSSVLQEMREKITQQLRDFWDAGIRGPDFVWAATGPALEAFSKYPAVKKANEPNQLMSVSEFLREVRRMVVDFVVGRVLSRDGEEAVTGLDDVTTYYLLHRNDFGMGEAPVGGCILYALSCNLSDAALVNQHDLLSKGKKRDVGEAVEQDGSEEEGEESGGGAKVKLNAWNRRTGRNLGLEGAGGRPVPLIDQVHKLMQLWRGGDQGKVNGYIDERGLQRNALFAQLLQALIELAGAGPVCSGLTWHYDWAFTADGRDPCPTV
jgi:adenine-specific DNA methylase